MPETIFDTFPLVYIRLHETPGMLYSGYSSEQLENTKNKKEGKKGFIYFNNTASTEGILNALELKTNYK
ncbi:MAG: hypothetical protein ABI793_13070 [Flavobacterium sp.]